MHEIPYAVKNAAEHAIAVRDHDRRVFRLLGTDGLDLLQRLSTNDLMTGPPNRSTLTSFCNEKGRLVGVAEIIVTPSETHLVCSATGTGKLMAWIAKYTIAEDIQLIDITSDFAVYSIIGPHAFSVAVALDLLMAERERNQVCTGLFIPAHSWEGMFGTLPAVRTLMRKGDAAEFPKRLKDAGVRVSESRAVHEFLRVLHAVPEFGHEITDSFNPYEAGLRDAVSLDKGCYVGQEVLARIETYQKFSKELHLLWSDAPEQPKRGTAVVVAGQTAGVVTSTARMGGRIIVLAIMEEKAVKTRDVIRISDYPYVINTSPIPPFSMLTLPESK